MKLNISLIVFFVAFGVLSSVPASAKDHSNDYRMGTLTKVPLHVGGKVSEGWTDTTSCNSGLVRKPRKEQPLAGTSSQAPLPRAFVRLL